MGYVIWFVCLAIEQDELERSIVTDSLVDRDGCQKNVKSALIGGGIMLCNNGFHHRPLCHGLI